MVSEWVNQTLLKSPTVLAKVDKLVRCDRRPAVLYVELDRRLREGFGVSLALESSVSTGGEPLELPPIELPEGIEELWLWPDMPGPGLRFFADGSWHVVYESEDAAAQLWSGSTGWVGSSGSTT